MNDVIQRLRDRERELETRLSEVRGTLALLEAGDEPPGKVEPRPAADPSVNGHAPKPPADAPTKCRNVPLLIAREIAAKGACRATDIAASVDVAEAYVGKNLRENPWFEKVTPGERFSPWQLTEAGRQAVTTA